MLQIIFLKEKGKGKGQGKRKRKRKRKGKEEELLIELNQDLERLEKVIKAISVNPNNWIVSDIQIFGKEVTRAELKPLDVSSYCKIFLASVKRL